eukprot:m.221040 g.221040  ORF g.221040 m.221040 type:complete len:209 (-) comp26310_c0_seq4:46-672(-)
MAKIKQESLRSRVAEQRWRRLMEDQEKKKQQDRIRRVPPPAEDDGLEEFDDEDNEFAPIDKSLQRTLKKEAEQRNKQPVIPTFQLGNPSTRKSNKIKSERHNPDSIRVRRVTAMLSQKIQQVLLSGRAGAIFMENSVELDEVVVNASLRHVVVRWHSQGKEQVGQEAIGFGRLFFFGGECLLCMGCVYVLAKTATIKKREKKQRRKTN